MGLNKTHSAASVCRPTPSIHRQEISVQEHFSYGWFPGSSRRHHRRALQTCSCDHSADPKLLPSWIGLLLPRLGPTGLRDKGLWRLYDENGVDAEYPDLYLSILIVPVAELESIWRLCDEKVLTLSVLIYTYRPSSSRRLEAG